MNNKFDFKSISSSQASIMGDLQRLLSQGEYAPFTSAPIFESKFVQVKIHLNEIIWHAQDKTACNDYPFFFPQLKRYSSFVCYHYSYCLFTIHIWICFLSPIDSFCSCFKGSSPETQQQQCCKLDRQRLMFSPFLVSPYSFL